MAGSWKDDELTALTGRLKRVGLGATTVSADAPTTFTNDQHIPAANMPSIYHAEHVRKTAAAAAITSGTLSGSQVALPRSPDTRPSLGKPGRSAEESAAGTVAFMDTAHSSRRLRDAASVESMHAAALAQNPRAFATCSGLASRYMHASTRQNYMTATQPAHQRLTSLEDTLARMQLHAAADGEPVHAGNAGRTASLASAAASSPRYDGLRLTRSAGGVGAGGAGGRGRTGGGWGADDAPVQQSDRSLLAAMTWKPDAVAPSAASATSTAIAEGRALTLGVPPPTPMLALQATSQQFLSRTSSRGVNPRLYTSGLQDALEQLVTDKVTDAAAPGGRVMAGSANGTGAGRAVTAPASGSAGATWQSGSFTLQPTPMRTGGRSRSPSQTSSHGRSQSPSRSQGQAQGQAQGQGQEQGQGQGQSRKGLRGSLAGGAALLQEDPRERAWIGLHPRDVMVTRMGGGDGIVRQAAVQARSVARQAPEVTVDLTHKFITGGQWSTMNFSGNTGSPGRRPLLPSPTRGNQMVVRATSPGFAPEQGQEGQEGKTLAGFAATGVTAFGDEQKPRQPSGLAEAPGGEDALRMGLQPLTRTANFSAELAQLDAFEDKFGLKTRPETWPRKVLISKIKASGLAGQVGMGDASTLESADHATLVSAYGRIPSAVRRQAMYGPDRRRSDPASFMVSMPAAAVPLPLRAAMSGRGVANLTTGPGTGVFSEPAHAAYTAGVRARVYPPTGRVPFVTRQEDVSLMMGDV